MVTNVARTGGATEALSHQRLDIQGLRMVAVLLVFATHLFGWPRGGFIGVDVFFVISGFLITGNLLRTADKSGNVSFKRFYAKRVRRIVPAATVVLIATFLFALLIFQPYRAHRVGLDALFAFIFMSNWWFAVHETNYFSAGDAVSPVQHFWSLSIEEQFYFVWPAVIFAIGLVVARRTLAHSDRIRLAGVVMAGIIAASFAWAWYQTLTSPAWAYFDTFVRVWELGVGALLATSEARFNALSRPVKIGLSWTGLALIALGALLIAESSPLFPAPLGLLPVVGSAMVIAAGINGEPAQPLLSHPISVYIGNISYSLYLVHWPVIVFLAVLMPVRGFTFYGAVIAVSAALSVASYHLVENPFRFGDYGKVRKAFDDIRKGRFRFQSSTRNAAIAALVLLTIGLSAYAVRPLPVVVAPPEPAPKTAGTGQSQQPGGWKLGPKGTELQSEIAQALSASAWPQLDPPLDSVINGATAPPEIVSCEVLVSTCAWGSEDATTRVALVGDSIGNTYAGPLRDIALDSAGKIRFENLALGGCPFVDADIKIDQTSVRESCPIAKQHAVDVINETKPDVVFVANLYGGHRLADGRLMVGDEWGQSLRRMIDKFAKNTKKIVFLAAPPAEKDIRTCYAQESTVPAECISKVTPGWQAQGDSERSLAAALNGVWVDSSPWFCTTDGLCPAFVGTTLTKKDWGHMSPAYGLKIHPVILESLKSLGAL